MGKLRLALGVIALAGPLAAWVGCGSSSDATIGGGDDAGAGDASSDSSPVVVDSGSPGDDAGDAGDAGDPDASNLPDGAIAADGGSNVPDASPGGSTTTLPCGTASCAIPGQSCCVESGGGSGRTYLCVVGPSANCPVTGGGDVIGLKCSGPSNCAAGEQCCANIADGGVVQSACVPSGTCAVGPGGGDHAVLCDKNAVTTGCDAGVTCTSNNIADWGLTNAFATCGGQGGPF